MHCPFMIEKCVLSVESPVAEVAFPLASQDRRIAGSQMVGKNMPFGKIFVTLTTKKGMTDLVVSAQLYPVAKGHSTFLAKKGMTVLVVSAQLCPVAKGHSTFLANKFLFVYMFLCCVSY